MPLTRLVFEITGRGVFELEGSFDLGQPELTALDRWLTSMASDDAAKLAALVAKLKRNTDAMEATVHAQAGTL